MATSQRLFNTGVVSVWGVFFKELGIFAWKEAQACLFAGAFFILLLLSYPISQVGIARYDFLLVGAILVQLVFICFKLETWEEMRVIFLFHILGFALEAFKTNPAIGSWAYPESAFFKIGTVPLYSGFMYSAVGSYINRAWKIFGLQFTNHPPYPWSLLVSALIYLNFFTHHFIWDARWVLSGLVLLLFVNTWVHFTIVKTPRKMPLAISFVLIGFFIWVAENVSTLLGAWKYPDQSHHWAMVSPQKICCWFLLVIISFNLVAWLQWKKERRAT